jgi:hypothetical protein
MRAIDSHSTSSFVFLLRQSIPPLYRRRRRSCRLHHHCNRSLSHSAPSTLPLLFPAPPLPHHPPCHVSPALKSPSDTHLISFTLSQHTLTPFFSTPCFPAASLGTS